MTDTYLDHVLIGVRDLEETAATFGRLGFTMTSEGVHPGRGTHNRLVVFGPEYLEMISVHDPSEVTLRVDLPGFLESREGLYMFALGTGDIGATAAVIRAGGAEVAEPVDGARGGERGQPGYTWRSAEIAHGATPGGHTFLIQHSNTYEERYNVPGPLNAHDNGVTGIHSLTLAVEDAGAAASQWRKALGLTALGRDGGRRYDGAWRVRLDLRTCYLDLVSPTGKGDLSTFLETHGPSPYELTLESRDLQATKSYLGGAGLSPQTSDFGGAMMVSPKDTHGVGLGFVQGKTG